jgi:hypothetical protein
VVSAPAPAPVVSSPVPQPQNPHSSPGDILLNRGIEKFNAGSYEEAKTLFRNALELGSADAIDWIRRLEDQERETQRAQQRVATTKLDLSEVRRRVNANVSSNTTQSFGGGRYKGETYNNHRTGTGIYYWDDGTMYIGGFNDDYRSGLGLYFVPDIEGYHVPNCMDCTIFVGDWVDNRRHGGGFCYDKMGKLLYYGDFNANMPVGEYPSNNDYSSYKFEVIKIGNDIYFGETRNGAANGNGIYISSDNSLWFGRWENGGKAGEGLFLPMIGDPVRQ